MRRATRDQEQVVEFFESLVAEHGATHKALAYGSERSQLVRFEVFAEFIREPEASVLDVGCGFADLYDFLRSRSWRGVYTGVDIAPTMVRVAAERHPDLDIRLDDVLTWPTSPGFDYVVATGFNCVRTGRNEAFLRRMMKKMYELAHRAAVLGMVSDYQQKKDERTYYASPERVFQAAMRLSGRVVLRHDYLPNDFTVCLYR